MVCNSDRETGHDMKKGGAKVRRQHPLRGMGYHNAKCLQVHHSDRMRGCVEPHTFAKFESLMFYVNLEFDNEDLEPRLRVDKDHRFVVEDETQVGATLGQADVIRNLVSLLSNSPFIDCLYILVAISLIPDFVFSPRP